MSRLPSNQRPPLGLLAFMASVVMLFSAFTAAYLVRRGGTDWQPIALPWLLWVNTAVLAASSVAIELARRRGRAWSVATGGFGLAFVVGQVFAWRQLADAGMYLPTNPHCSFLYLLTAVHGMHVLGGVGSLLWAFGRPWRIGTVALYWHFMGAVWAYLLLLLGTV